MNVLLTGATGLLGSYLLKTAKEADTLYSQRFDILDRDAVYKAFDEAKPEVVIHCAGEGRVDYAEEHRCEAWRTTYEGLENVARAAHYWSAHLVFISSNSVYNGLAYPCNEDTLHDPIHTYGKYKSTCEDLVNAYAYKRTIIRPIMLYGWPKPGRRDNMVTRLIRDLETQGLKGFGQIPVAEDIITQPTYADDCAAAIWNIIAMQTEEHQSVNVGAYERMSLFKFAVEVAKAFDKDPSLIVPVKSETMKGYAPRPKDTTFGLGKLSGMGIVLNGAAEGLARMKAEKA